MRIVNIGGFAVLALLTASGLTSCASSGNRNYDMATGQYYYNNESDYMSRIPDRINTGGSKVVVVDPNAHVWGAYGADGQLQRAGLATAGGNWCDDINRPCRTATGTFRIQSMGDESCRSKTYPRPNGGGLMPYCMFFSNGMALHGSPYPTVVEDNISHGCVRMRIPDAEWVRYNFASVGTKVIVKPY